MHIFCTECGKHIDVSLEELENQGGHLVCPQCLASIDVDVDLFNGTNPQRPVDPVNIDDPDMIEDIHDSESVSISESESESESEPPTLPQPATPPAPPSTTPAATQPPHVDDVMRYCRHCGAFLREGINFCPRCGKYVRVAPPNYKQPRMPRPGTPSTAQATSQNINQLPPPNPSTTVPQHNIPRRSSNSKKSSSGSKFSIYSVSGCLTLTLVTVALFFIIYIVLAVTLKW